MDASAQAPDVLTVDSIAVTYPSFRLKPTSFALGSGEVATLMGPNGSGKTTLLRAILGMQAAEGYAHLGDSSLSERNPYAIAQIGFVSDSADDVLPELSPMEYWDFCALARERYLPDSDQWLDRAEALADEFDLVIQDAPLRTLSFGTRRKVQLCAGFMHAPDLVILDEPLTGLDFFAVRALERVVASARDSGATILLASHNLEVANRTSDRVLLLHRGDLIADDATERMRAGGDLTDGVEAILSSSRSGGSP